MLPIIATLLSQGLGLLGNAILNKGVEVINEKLGVDVEELALTSEGRQKLAQLQMDHEEFLINAALENRKLDIQEKAIDVDNTKSARDMNTRIQESVSGSFLAKNIVAVLALLVVTGGGAMLAWSPNADVRTAAVGLVTLVLGFYFGTSSGSKAKDDTIKNLTGIGGQK
jgi:hypothetical protein